MKNLEQANSIYAVIFIQSFVMGPLLHPAIDASSCVKVVNESLRKICHYQQNVSQHYFILDTRSQNLRRILRIHRFLSECIAFNQSALRHSSRV